MNAREFGLELGNDFEKDAIGAALGRLGAAATSAAQKAVAPAVKGFTRATAQGASPAYAAGRALRGQVMSSGVGRGAVNAGQMLASAPEATGKFVTNTARRAGNLMDPAGRAGSVAMDAIGASQRGGNLTNKLVGAGALTGGYAAGKNYLSGGEADQEGGGGGFAVPPTGAGAAPGIASGGGAGAGNSGAGLMGMWNSLPMEARYAIGAGVPLALAGGLMGMRGNTGAGLGLGALGLGAAGLGLAGSGAFGDGARRLVGQGANSLYGMIGGGGGGGDMQSQLNALKGLSPEFGTTMLMGKDPTGQLTSQQARGAYDFLTTNPAASAFLPGIENASVRPGSVMKAGAALAEKLSERRCWKGYEAVPGVKPFSRGSCRPVNAQKDTDSPKPEAAGDSDASPKSEKSSALNALARAAVTWAKQTGG
jgi:hypothetical protein